MPVELLILVFDLSSKARSSDVDTVESVQQANVGTVKILRDDVLCRPSLMKKEFLYIIQAKDDIAK